MRASLRTKQRWRAEPLRFVCRGCGTESITRDTNRTGVFCSRSCQDAYWRTAAPITVLGCTVPRDTVESAVQILRTHAEFDRATIRRILEDRGVEGRISSRAADRITKMLSERNMARFEVSPTKRWLWRKETS